MYKTPTWETYLKEEILRRLDERILSVESLKTSLFGQEVRGFIFERYHHRLLISDIHNILIEMYLDYWIEVEEYKCECCRLGFERREEVLRHAVSFKISPIGKSKIPEEIFP